MALEKVIALVLGGILSGCVSVPKTELVSYAQRKDDGSIIYQKSVMTDWNYRVVVDDSEKRFTLGDREFRIEEKKLYGPGFEVPLEEGDVVQVDLIDARYHLTITNNDKKVMTHDFDLTATIISP